MLIAGEDRHDPMRPPVPIGLLTRARLTRLLDGLPRARQLGADDVVDLAIKKDVQRLAAKADASQEPFEVMVIKMMQRDLPAHHLSFPLRHGCAHVLRYQCRGGHYWDP